MQRTWGECRGGGGSVALAGCSPTLTPPALLSPPLSLSLPPSADNYALPGYFGPQRWDYYRLNSLGHNVLVFDNSSQSDKARAAVDFSAAPWPAVPLVDGFAVVPLSSAYAAHTASVNRGFVSLANSSAVLIVDELTYGSSPSSANLTWQLHTRAAATAVDARTLSLLRPGSGSPAALLALLPSPASSCPSFSSWHITPLQPFLTPPQDPAKGFFRVDALVLQPAQAGFQCSRLAVALGDAAVVVRLQAGEFVVNALQDWDSKGPLAVA